ncbi:hypothetical protein PM082_002074 [Marasmius tenuissimus]|nr:hypothetical protein PM082_002074 [Marasmius tenuissimus]
MFKVMLRLSKKSGIFPKCLKINNVKKLGSHPVAGGGFGNVWKGRIADEIVCLKVVEVYPAFDVQQLLKLTDYPGIPRQSRYTIFKIMLRLSNHSGMFPRCLKINNVERLGLYPVAGGGFGDV